MPATVSGVLEAAGLVAGGCVRWSEPVSEQASGVYVVALTSEEDSSDGALAHAPVDLARVDELLAVRPELTLDGRRPSARELAERLEAFWLADEVVLYIGLAGTFLRKRVQQYYRTPLGARSPHAGGWFVKTLSVLPRLFVHYSACDSVRAAESAMLTAFATGVSSTARDSLRDAERVMPFANLESPPGNRKRHGIAGAKEPRAPRPARVAS